MLPELPGVVLSKKITDKKSRNLFSKKIN